MRNSNAESLKHFKNLLEECIKKIGGNDLYKEDTRLLKIWLLYVRPINSIVLIFLTVYSQYIELQLEIFIKNPIWEACTQELIISHAKGCLAIPIILNFLITYILKFIL